MSPEPVEELEKMRQEMGLTFPLLSDPELSTVKAYGILNLEHPSVPHPTALVLDKEGVVRYLRVDENYKVRPPAEELLDAVRKAGAQGR